MREMESPAPLAAARASDTSSLAAVDGLEGRPNCQKTRGIIAAAIGVPSPEAIAEIDEMLLDELCEAFWLIESYAKSGVEASRRGDREEIKLRLRVQLRDCFRHAVATHDLLLRSSK
jgi:hypothetical protein